VLVEELAQDRALIDAHAKFEEYRRGVYEPVDRDGLAALRAMTGGWKRDGQLLDDIPE
jgi:hypothetical protein